MIVETKAFCRCYRSVVAVSVLTLLLSSVAVAQPGGGPSGPPGGGGGGAASGVGNSPINSSQPGQGQGGTVCPTNSGAEVQDPVEICIQAPALADDISTMVPELDECGCDSCGAASGSSPGLVMPGGTGGGLSSGGAGGGSCFTCGGSSGGVSAPSGGFSANNVDRLWMPNNRVSNSSFSPGFYSQFDSQVEIFEETGGTTISFLDVYAKSVYLFVDGLDGDTQDGVFHDLRNNHSRKLELLNGSGTLVTDPSNAVKVVVTHWNGVSEEFELIDLDTDPTAEQIIGRLTKRSSRIGEDLTVNYKSWTQTQIDASPERQWQIDTVTDERGNTLTFTYSGTQYGGRWCVSKIERHDGVDVDFAYASDALSTVTFEDGSQASYTYGQDTATQTATVTIDDPREAKQFVHYLTNDYMSLDSDGEAQVINQPTGVWRMIANDDDELIYTYIPHSDQSVDQAFIHLGGNYAIVQSGDGTYQEWDNWGPAGPGPQIIFAGIDGDLNSQVIGADGSTTTGDLYNGQIPSFTDSSGRQYTALYDADGNVTKKTYVADSSYEEYAYNSFGQVTRARSREGDVTKYTYDSVGNVTQIERGLVEQGGSDVQSSSYAVETKEYYPSSHANANQLKTEKDALYSGSQPTLHRTDYEYDSQNRLTKVTEAADAVGGTRPETTYTYTNAGLLSSTTDPEGRVTSYTYDSIGRLTQTTYPDTSNEQTLYGSGANEGRIVKTKDRVGTVTSYTYDSAGRLTQTVVGSAVDANILDGNPDDTVITDVNQQNRTAYTYLEGSEVKASVTHNGAKTDYVYDFYNRVTEVKTYPRSGKTLVSKKAYEDNQLLYDEDPYGRRKYYGYRASDGTLIRMVICTNPSYTLADFTAVWNLSRDTSANADYIVHDAIRDDDGNLTEIIDGRNVKTLYEYDAQGREIKRTEAHGTSIAVVTETDYDDAGNVTEVRSPRYFDSSDSEGHNKAKENWTYNGRNLVATHTEAAGSSVAATESYTYHLDGHQKTHTDFRGKVWEHIDDTCCGKSTASKNPLGHGSIRNTDPAGRVTHTATVSDVSSHVTNMLSPINNKTLSESTTKYDALGRQVASTTWLVARGQIDPEDPPIAGLSGVSASDGLTTQYLYDNNLADGTGLDSSGGVSKLIGSGSVSLSNALSKLASGTSSGGASTSFSSTAPGRASVVINGEGEVSFSISDAAGRSVMSGQLDSSNNLITWSCQQHDNTASVSGFGTCLETRSIDALGKMTKSRTDGAGRTLQALDQLNKVTTFTYDAGGNQLSVRDPNNVGQDMLYDQLGRAGLTTDTAGDTTNSTYDKAGNRLTAVDGKGESTSYVYDARGRQKSQTDRLGNATTFAYLATGQLASLTDAESQTTSYTYDDVGQKLTEQYPDHTGGSPGSSNYGIVTFVNDEAGRVERKQDQNGDTVTYNYDLAGRLTSRDYRTRANSPTGTIADSDTFTYDDAGRMLTADSGRYNNVVTYTYDDAGRKATEALEIASRTYATTSGYDDKGQLTTLTYPDGTVITRSYTDRGELYQLKQGSTTLDTRTYDNGGRMTASSYNNGVSESRSYNNDNTLSSISYTGASIGNLSYGWDDNKNKTSESITGTMSGYGFSVPTNGYDDEDRLVSFNRTDGNLDQSWNLSDVGDWNGVTTEGTTQSRTHGPSHELIAGGGGSVNHDVKGNMTSIPSSLRPTSSSLSMSWDMDNRMSSATTGSTTVSHAYDALGRRVSRTVGLTTTVFVQSGQQTIADYPSGAAASSPTYRYVYASYIDEPVYREEVAGSDDIYYHRNQQYSVTALTGTSGAILERYAYSAYGVPTITTGSGTTVLASSAESNRYAYTGREWDGDISLYYYRARMYDPELGRFCSKDPIGYLGSEWNQYEYLSSSPIVGTDPLGLFDWGSWGGCLRNRSNRPILTSRYDEDLPGWIYEWVHPGDDSPWRNDVDYVWYNGQWWKINQRWGSECCVVITASGSIGWQCCYWEHRNCGAATWKCDPPKPFKRRKIPRNKQPNNGNPPPLGAGREE